jgi:SAM-dependent methyltransferase
MPSTIEPTDEQVLDVACGTGNLALPAARAGALVTGIDIAPNLIEQAQASAAEEGLPVAFEVGDAERLPYADAGFGTVVSMFGTMFAARPERAAAVAFEFPFGPADVVGYFERWYGPTLRAFAALDATRQADLRRDLERLWTSRNEAGDGTTRVQSEYLEVIATVA